MADEPSATQTQGKTQTTIELEQMGAARLRNDLDRDGTQDQLRGGFEDGRMPAFAELERDRRDLDRVGLAERDTAAEKRWTVQRFDESRGVYRDTLSTDSALVAREEFERGREYRVLDNQLKDYAADYKPAQEQGFASANFGVEDVERDYHARSTFEADAQAEQARFQAIEQAIAAERYTKDELDYQANVRAEREAATKGRQEAVEADLGNRTYTGEAERQEAVERQWEADRAERVNDDDLSDLADNPFSHVRSFADNGDREYSGEAERQEAWELQQQRDRADQVDFSESTEVLQIDLVQAREQAELAQNDPTLTDAQRSIAMWEATEAEQRARAAAVEGSDLAKYLAHLDAERERQAQRVETKEEMKSAEAASMEADPEHQAMVATYQREMLQDTLNRRAALQADVDQQADLMAKAADRIRHEPQDLDAVQADFAQSSMAYAKASQDLAAFQQQPSKDLDVAAKFREIEQSEQEVEQARQDALHARLDGTAQDKQQEAEARQQAAQRRTDAILEREGVTLPPGSDRTVNTVEPGLSEQQIRTLMTREKRDQAERQLDAEAQAVASKVRATPNIGEAQNQVRDQSAFADAQAKDKLVPEDVAAAYKRDGQKYLDANDPKKVAFVDKGNRLQTIRTFDDKAVESMIQTADARGWSEVKVSGDEAFRRKAWIEATARGIEVKGYEPTEKDKLRAEQLAKQTGHANAIEKNETLEAYRVARDGNGKDKREAALKHPELANAFALEAAARSFAKQRLDSGSQEMFVEKTRENIERSLAQGKSVPEIRRRQEQERRQDRGVER